ncbi:aldose reductase-like [Limulus polyphemus]|uniref:Aldose reductase-like n=1 Tax=Limulus polyphemus TaxID=6850 RepID=A0ABM1C360_LIMPO|nr:aldose reductase-like [Limulus polyphemus]
MASHDKVVHLASGQNVPIIGLGTWKSPPGKVKQAVIDAIDAGYRQIDSALVYGNESEVGAGLKEKISDGTITREDVFIIDKCWNTFHKRERVVECCKLSLKNLGLEYLDLYLIHWPLGYKV